MGTSVADDQNIKTRFGILYNMDDFVIKVYGPFEVNHQNRHSISPDDGKRFWKNRSCATLAKRRGWYVFGIRASKGLKPWYVGKAGHTFSQEVFHYHKLSKYTDVIDSGRKGTPILFLLTYPNKKGKINNRLIGEVENYLIQMAAHVNPLIKNEQGVKPERWSIAGVMRSGWGDKDAKYFRKMMQIKK
jgi:hypothetical protein